MYDLPSTEAILAVLEAARGGSMTAAAESLGVTHGAVSRRVQAVEHWLGAPVFERQGRGVRLTPQGSHFVRRAERAIQSIHSIRSEMSMARRPQTIRISVLPSLARLWLMPRFAILQAAAADGWVIDVLTDHRLAKLEAREADIAIRFGHGAWPDTTAEMLFRDEVRPVATAALAARLAGCSPAGLLSETLIHDSDGADWRLWCRAAGIGYAPIGGERRFLDHDLALDAAQQGLGIALARLPLGADRLLQGSLVALEQPSYVSDRAHYIVLRSGETRRAVLAIADLLSRGVEPRDRERAATNLP